MREEIRSGGIFRMDGEKEESKYQTSNYQSHYSNSNAQINYFGVQNQLSPSGFSDEESKTDLSALRNEARGVRNKYMN